MDPDAKSQIFVLRAFWHEGVMKIRYQPNTNEYPGYVMLIRRLKRMPRGKRLNLKAVRKCGREGLEPTSDGGPDQLGGKHRKSYLPESGARAKIPGLCFGKWLL